MCFEDYMAQIVSYHQGTPVLRCHTMSQSKAQWLREHFESIRASVLVSLPSGMNVDIDMDHFDQGIITGHNRCLTHCERAILLAGGSIRHIR